LKLKEYQKRTVKELEDYLDLMAQIPEGVKNRYQVAFNSLRPEPPYKINKDLDVPYVCIKIPTGGGKTFVAVHIINSVYEKFLKDTRSGKGLVIWSVPSTAILYQTLKNLKDPNHPYRQALNQFFSNNVKIFNFKEAMELSQSDLENNLCIFVTTFGGIRIEAKELRRAYRENGQLNYSFEGVDDSILDKDKDKTIIPSLMNVIKLENPVLIIDEGHGMKTKLSYDLIKNMNPCFVLEYTATPIPDKSNVIVNVTTQELQDENMVKIPINLSAVAPWQQTIRHGVKCRDELGEIAKKEKGEYIRPIALIQAEREIVEKDKVNVQQIVDFLKKEHKVTESQIAIKTSKQDSLTGIDLYSKKCEILYIITVNALREGWDHNFPYVLISVSNIGTKVSVEQIIGRILRLPKQKLKKHPELNESYVFTSHQRFEQAADELVKGLKVFGYAKNNLKKYKSEKEKESFKKIISDNDINIPFISIVGRT